ncbi:NAD(P)/FAD-dependent oxidoreductase [Pontibacterium sp.]|uniref:NAD(P)/FAD-dependent oxidoreductase n=1 Tax=Pontibacterium sp. TaxID=2036026 RepID=UPI00351753A4
MRKIKRMPAIDGQLGWYETVPFQRPMPVQHAEKDEHFDIIVAGGGFSGLATAGRLAELQPDAKIALVDALEIGQGTAGRNAGFIIDLPHNLDADEPNPDHDAKIRDLNCFAIERLKHIQEQQGLNVRWHAAGKYLAAHEEKHFCNLAAFTTTLDAMAEKYEVLDGNDLAKKLGTPYYKRAVYTPGNILMNPAALAITVASALPKNVSLLENTPIRSVDLENKTLQTDKAKLTADTLVLATNAFTEEFGGCRNKLAPVFTYASMTRPLTSSEMAQFKGVEPWGLTSAHPAGTTVRLTPDHRLFIRNTLDFLPELSSTDTLIGKAREKHRRSYIARFPQLKDIPFEFSWGGMLCMTMNHESVFKQHAPGVYVVAAMNGVGVAKGTYLGNYMAEYISGIQSTELDFSLKNSNPSWVPSDPMRTVAARIRLSFEERLAKGEV